MADTSTPDKASPLRELLETLRTVTGGVLIALAIHSVVAQPFTIPSSSMEPTLVTGDYIIVSKFAYGWSGASLPFDLPLGSGRLLGKGPQRGDVVVFRLPRDPGQVWVKRVIGLPGDRVQVRAGIVSVNDVVLRETFMGATTDHDQPLRPVTLARETLPEGRVHALYTGDPGAPQENTGVYVVPPGDYFMMGDNRDNSLDSRWPGTEGVGFLPARNILGRAMFIVASWRPGSSLFKPWTWLNFQPGRFGRAIT